MAPPLAPAASDPGLTAGAEVLASHVGLCRV